MTFTFFVALASIMFLPIVSLMDMFVLMVSKAEIESHVQLLQSSDVEALILIQQQLINSLTQLVHEYEISTEVMMAELESLDYIVSNMLQKETLKNIKPTYGPFDVPHPANMQGLIQPLRIQIHA